MAELRTEGLKHTEASEDADRRQNQLPNPHAIRISPRAADRIRKGHGWIYRSDIVEHRASGSQPPPGAGVTVVDSRGLPLGSGLWSDASEISIRMVSPHPGLRREDYLKSMRDRISAAIVLRREIASEVFRQDSGNNACRLVFSEADGLPGIVIDRYGELVIVQLLIQGTAQPDVRALVRELLKTEDWIGTLVERGDPRVRELEQLESPATEVLWSRTGQPAALETSFQVNGLCFVLDPVAGQKTGAFLDQRLNYLAAAEWASAVRATHRALDICTYHGGFALHLGRVCDAVTGVDASRTALETADRNRATNLDAMQGEVDWVEADAFELLRDWQQAGERFDTIVLDPPAFAKNRRSAEGALRGDKELNLRAMKMLGGSGPGSPGASGPQHPGLLVSCSCSHHVSQEDFLEMLRAAALDAGRRVQVLEARGAAPDHPAILSLPETSYLKCIVCRVA
jgi:23S rRNA (cytosine1962-C5)-methyltransferase